MAINGFIKEKKTSDLVLFHEYFHGDNLRGLGASHQTGWTALIVNLIVIKYELILDYIFNNKN